MEYWVCFLYRMSRHQTSSRQLKKKIQKLLLQKNFESGLAEIGRIPARKGH